jgi:hypothetical protein
MVLISESTEASMIPREADWAEQTIAAVERRRRHWRNVGWHALLFGFGFIAIWFLMRWLLS